MKSNAPFCQTRFGPIAARKTVRADGSILVNAEHGLDAYPDRLTDWLLHWAAAAPDRTFIARRNEKNEWVRLSYAETLRRVRNLAQALLDRHLSTERTVVILSGNSLEHQLLSLAAMHVGIPYAPISPPYSLLSKDFGKLRRTLELMTPGLILVQDGAHYARALAAVLPPASDVELVVVDNPTAQRPSTPFADLLATTATPAVDEAAAGVGPDTVAKVLFTSGSTSLPKGVINTNRMICANLQQIYQTMPFLGEEPPVIVDWLPWNHTFGGNHNIGLILANGGAFYLDEGKPTPDGIETTVANLREIAPTMYFNVPRGMEELLPYLQREPALRKTFFSRLKMLFYAGAALPQHVWDGLEQISAQTTGHRVPIITGLGMTESGPSAMFAHWPGSYSGLLGVPVPGLELKLTPVEGKLEARYRGPNVAPGYWRQPELNAASFDEEGFFRTGDAIRFVDANNPNKGLLFDGRLAEDFKLTTGTWVSVGALRAQIVKLGAPLVREAVITGHNRDYVGALLFLHVDACQALAGVPADTPATDVYAHAAIQARIQQLLDDMAAQATGISNRLERVTIASEPPSIDVGEITDKGSFNQRAILQHRAALVEELYEDPRREYVLERVHSNA